jgi:hypothetical protein
MKTALYGVMLGALLAAGCIPKAPFAWPDDTDPATYQTSVQPVRKHASPVRADQVTAENAHEKAQALEEELEGESEAPK